MGSGENPAHGAQDTLSQSDKGRPHEILQGTDSANKLRHKRSYSLDLSANPLVL